MADSTRIIDLTIAEKVRLWDGRPITDRRVLESIESLHRDLVLCESAMRASVAMIRTERRAKATRLRQQRWLQACRDSAMAAAEERAG